MANDTSLLQLMDRSNDTSVYPFTKQSAVLDASCSEDLTKYIEVYNVSTHRINTTVNSPRKDTSVFTLEEAIQHVPKEYQHSGLNILFNCPTSYDSSSVENIKQYRLRSKDWTEDTRLWECDADKIRGIGVYSGGKDVFFYCGRFSGNDALINMNNELNKLHYMNGSDYLYKCECLDINEIPYKTKINDSYYRTIPLGLCSINYAGSHILFINNVISYASDEWTQTFINSSIIETIIDGQKKYFIANGNDVVIRKHHKDTGWSIPVKIQAPDIENMLTRVRGLGTYEDGLYTAKKDMLFYCGDVSDSSSYITYKYAKEELDKLGGSPSERYTCGPNNTDFPNKKRVKPQGLCHISLWGNNIWFINSCTQENRQLGDKWKQTFFNAGVVTVDGVKYLCLGDKIVERVYKNGEWSEFTDIEQRLDSSLYTRFIGSSDLYNPGTDTFNYLGSYNNNNIGGLKTDLDSLHGNSGEASYESHSIEYSGKTRKVPHGICHINRYGSRMWFINNVISYQNDQWTQIFLNAKREGDGVVPGQNIIIRTYENNEWSSWYEIPFSIIEQVNKKADKTTVDTSLNLKADKTTVNNLNTEVNKKADSSTVDASLNRLLNELRGFGVANATNDMVPYIKDKDPIFYCGKIINADLDAQTLFNRELDKLHSPNFEQTAHHPQYNSLDNGMYESDLRNKIRPVPIGLCHINKNGSDMWFINNVEGYENDKWTQVFFNAKISGRYTDADGNKMPAISYGRNIVTRTRVKEHDSDQKYTKWGTYIEIPCDILEQVNKKADTTTVDASLALKADKKTVDASLNLKADKTTVNNLNTEVNKKADKTTVNTLENKVNTKTTFHAGTFNAGNITEEGWYDAIDNGRPEGSESDEKYYLYHSANGGQICFSRRNSGKAYHRSGKKHPWVPLTHDDYSIENPLATLYKSCTLKRTYDSSSISGSDYHTPGGYAYDSPTNLTEFYAGGNNEITHFHISLPLDDIKSGDIIRVRCVYRRGFSPEGVNTYPYDSDAYMFVSKNNKINDSFDENHSITNNESNWIKIKSMGGQNFPFTDGEKRWQGLTFMRDRFFDEHYEYSWHYIRVTAPQVGGNNYLHIYGDFTKPGSWFVFDKAEVYRSEKQEKIITDITAITPTKGTYTQESSFVPGTYIISYNNGLNWMGGTSEPVSVIYPLTKSKDGDNEFYWYKKANAKYRITSHSGYPSACTIDENTGAITCPLYYGDPTDANIVVNAECTIGDSSFVLESTKHLVVKSPENEFNSKFKLYIGAGSYRREMEFPWDPFDSTSHDGEFSTDSDDLERYFRNIPSGIIIGNIVTVEKSSGALVRYGHIKLYVGSSITATCNVDGIESTVFEFYSSSYGICKFQRFRYDVDEKVVAFNIRNDIR